METFTALLLPAARLVGAVAVRVAILHFAVHYHSPVSI